MSDDLMDELRNAVAEARANEETSDATGGVDSVQVDAEPVQGEVLEAAETTTAEAAGPSPGEGRARGPDGKFVQKAEATETKAPTPGAKALVKPSPVVARAATKPPTQPSRPTSTAPLGGVVSAPTQGSASDLKTPGGKYFAPTGRPPQSVKRELAQKWDALQPEWRDEIERLEWDAKRGIERGNEKSVEATRFHESFTSTMAPYRAMLGGADPVRATQSLMQAAHTLNYAPPQAKAQLLARMIKDSGVPIELLDSELSGQPAAPSPSNANQMDPRALTAQIKAELMEDMRLQQNQQKVEAFVGTRPEFFEDVQSKMVAILKAGLANDYESAYDQACWADPEIRATLQRRQAEEAQRERAQRANEGPNGPASTQRARIAGSSVKSQPAPAPPGPQVDRTEDILREELAKARRG